MAQLPPPIADPGNQPSEPVPLQRRSTPGQLRYLAAKLREDEDRRSAVAFALDVLADELEAT